ncbi:hypothetical protein [Thermobifida cellulosilytica]|nr:hypothetical protein [Thermobifida cellulosilytica]
MVSALNILVWFFGDAAETAASWLWGALGVLVGAGIAAAVISSRRRT